jgi:dTDP-4-dehydrorhamnose reductase
VAKLLITGAGGMLGANLVLDGLAAGHHVIAVDFEHPVRHTGVESVVVDLSLPGAARDVFAAHRPEWIVHCAAATNVDACEADPQTAFRLNRDMAGQVAMAAHAVGARLAHVSTDAIFDGERGSYTEEDQPHPINVYGASKLEGESVVLAEHPGALIIRTNIYGWNAQAKQSLAEWFLARLEAGQETPGFTDAWFTPILVNDLNDRLFRMLGRRLQGIFHVAGSECISKHRFGVMLAATFGLDAGLVREAASASARLPTRRGPNLGLQVRRAESTLGAKMPDVESGLMRFRSLRDTRVRQLKLLLRAGTGWDGPD